jgi:adenosyl cobinamide kinase/adenosyl cobinamide phosphate guanylyltransferase
MGRLILITGGVRSGRSAFAEALAGQLGGAEVLFVATAEARDEEMAARIAAHRQTRCPAWRTIEAPRQVGAAIRHAAPQRVVILDCLTLLVSNCVLSLGEQPAAEQASAAVEAELAELIAAVEAVAGVVIVVTNEVGWGIVPENRLARLFRDLLGHANARLARLAERVYLLVAGVAVELKSLSRWQGYDHD